VHPLHTGILSVEGSVAKFDGYARPVTSTTPAQGPIARLRGAIDVLYREVIKFGVIGIIAFVIDMGSFNLLRHTVLDDKPTAAVIISASIATAFAWVGNRAWTFRHRRSRPAHHEAALFAGTNGVALLIQAAAVAVSNYVLGFESLTADNVAKVVGIGLGTLFRFWAYRRFVFAGEPIDVDQSPLADLKGKPEGPA
jgi:putative flippase GtrA